MPRYSFTDFAFNIRLVEEATGRSCRVVVNGTPGNLFVEIQELDRFGTEILPSSDDDSSVEEVAPPARPPVNRGGQVESILANRQAVVDFLNSSGSSTDKSPARAGGREEGTNNGTNNEAEKTWWRKTWRQKSSSLEVALIAASISKTVTPVPTTPQLWDSLKSHLPSPPLSLLSLLATPVVLLSVVASASASS
ncbi:unknown protein [Seminavis robusta]|uniref:Uncharacterized protein n=1 Tax=Seminavis robusta TaxID=568900 RepID=A0A9N8HVE7_9STRA|nr:unknown protein [Seminavis robusta]|eukprot:Sro1975_g308760.1 n/a (194) ;mRNA; r:1137-1718